MSNTLNQLVELPEYTYPFLVERYQIRKNSGDGFGKPLSENSG